MRITVVNSAIWPSRPGRYGSEVQPGFLVEGLLKAGHSVNYIAATGSVPRAHFLPIPCANGDVRLSDERKAYDWYRDEILTSEYVLDFSGTHMVTESLRWWDWNKFKGKTLWIHNGNEWPSPRPPIIHDLPGAVYSEAQKAHGLSRAGKIPEWIAPKPENIHVVPYGFPSEPWVPVANPTLDYVLFFARPTKDKGIFEFLEVAKRLPERKFVMAFDSVAGYSPVLVGVPNGRFLSSIGVTEIEDLFEKTVGEMRTTSGGEQMMKPSQSIYVFNGSNMAPRWSKVFRMIRHRYRGSLVGINARGGRADVTPNHSVMVPKDTLGRGSSIADAGKLKIGDSIITPSLKDTIGYRGGLFIGTKNLAFNLGLFAAEGSCGGIRHDGRRTSAADIGNTSASLINHWADEMSKSFNCRIYVYEREVNGKPYYRAGTSHKGACEFFRQEFYTGSGLKKVPDSILNAPRLIQESFIEGYLRGDGHKLPDSSEWSFDTNSQTLALGLMMMLRNVGKRGFSIHSRTDKPMVVSIHINEDSHWGQSHLKEKGEITKILRIPYDGWVYDLETDTHTFTCGVGPVEVHNTAAADHQYWGQKAIAVAENIPNVKYIPLEGSLDLQVKLLQNAECVLAPLDKQYCEGWGLTNGQALLCGTPVVTASHGAPPEIFTPETGILCTAGDIDAYVAAVAKAPSLSGGACRRLMLEKFSIERWVKNLESLYEKLVMPP